MNIVHNNMNNIYNLIWDDDHNCYVGLKAIPFDSLKNDELCVITIMGNEYFGVRWDDELLCSSLSFFTPDDEYLNHLVKTIGAYRALEFMEL